MFFVLQMIGVIGFKNSVVYDGVRLKWIGKPFEIRVHDVFVECPFKEAAIDNASDESKCLPKKEFAHK
jgi:hypothetical protein